MESKRSTTKDRMQEVLSILGVTAVEFERNCGLAHGFCSRVTRVITKKTRICIKTAYPMLNIDYIALGTGDVFIKEGEAQTTIKDRLRLFLDTMHVGRKEFAQKTGVSETLICNMSENLRNTSLERIYRAFPMLSVEWLEYGEGKMIVEEQETDSDNTPLDRVEELIKFLGITKTAFLAETGMSNITNNITKKTVDKIVRRYPFVSPLWLMHGKGEMYDTGSSCPTYVSLAPLLSQKMFTDDWSAKHIDSLPRVPYSEDEDTKGEVIAVEVFGDSMDDGTSMGYRNEDIVIAKKILVDNVPFMRYDFVIVHKRELMIRRIVEVNDKTITVRPLNRKYADRLLDKKDISRIFIITTRISKQQR